MRFIKLYSLLIFFAFTFLDIISCTKGQQTQFTNNQSVQGDSVVKADRITKVESNNKKIELAKYDSVKFEDVHISGVHFGISTKSLMESFGQPDSISNNINEFDGSETTSFYYDSNVFSFTSGSFDGFQLYSNDFYFLSESIIVGQTTSELINAFPISYRNRMNTGNGTEEVLRIMIAGTYDYIAITVIDDEISGIIKWNSY